MRGARAVNFDMSFPAMSRQTAGSRYLGMVVDVTRPVEGDCMGMLEMPSMPFRWSEWHFLSPGQGKL